MSLAASPPVDLATGQNDRQQVVGSLGCHIGYPTYIPVSEGSPYQPIVVAFIDVLGPGMKYVIHYVDKDFHIVQTKLNEVRKGTNIVEKFHRDDDTTKSPTENRTYLGPCPNIKFKNIALIPHFGTLGGTEEDVQREVKRLLGKETVQLQRRLPQYYVRTPAHYIVSNEERQLEMRVLHLMRVKAHAQARSLYTTWPKGN